MNWGRDSHLWEGVIGGVVMVATWAAMTGGALIAPLTPMLLNIAGAAGAVLVVGAGLMLFLRSQRS